MRLGLIGYGNIAATLLGLLERTGVRPAHLAVLARPGSGATVRARIAADAADVPALAGAATVVEDAAGLLGCAPDLVVECAGHGGVAAHVPAILRAGVDLVLVSVGAMSDAALEASLRAAATEGGARIILPAGAVGGIDLLAALAPAGGLEVIYRGSKPPRAWAGTPAEAALDLDTLTERRVFFQGSAREAARDYPKNANVAATLALAGAGFEATRVELIADPAAAGNMHSYEVRSPVANYRMEIENLPSAGNAKTSVSTVYSVLREVRNRMAVVAI
ncbi:aspartate dehydrogenase [Antarcticimicrobium luteum]|uniref:L-aspartate dehydrogenase n=1 Tax=Antarcticimicrobium luteum TaxID=2547397 RepID=A0A4R5UQG4_9RHOB|nr:aspartate dehydrogenase [Antarcticimicrobium luteum]TDK41146.1 aspartate dehydrogenase [Antarcticimicrobium luteum]